jgi:hypothetical protein
VYTSLKKLSNVLILKQEGTSRQERYMPALHESDELMDKRGIKEMLAYMQRFSKNLRFFGDDENDPQQNWEHFFKNDILFLIANVATKDVTEINTRYKEFKQVFEKEKAFGNFYQLADFVFTRIKKINEWYLGSFADQSLNNDFTLYIRSYLQNELATLREIIVYSLNELNQREELDRFRNEILALHEIWNVNEEDIQLRERIFAGKDDLEKLTSAAFVLDRTFDTILQATGKVIEKSAVYFSQAIHTGQTFQHNHHPHVALIIAFLKLLEYQQKELNAIPQRHLHYYYSKVLRIRGKEAIPDETFLLFQLAKGFNSAFIPAGTRVSAGKDKKNNELIYRTVKDLVINNAQVDSINSIFIERNSRKEILDYFVDSFQLPHQDIGSEQNGFSCFGQPARGKTSGVGFAISSSQLFLAKGERKITLTIEGPDAFLPVGEETSEPIALDETILRIEMTGKKGWIDSLDPRSGISINSLKIAGNRSIELSLSISITQEEPVTAYNQKIHGGNFDARFPILQCMFRYPKTNDVKREEQVRQINLLQKFRMANVSIAVQAGSLAGTASFDGVKDLLLENDDAALEYKKPFFPFTALPKVGSSFYIGCNDLFYKDINDLTVNIEWLLPEHFSTYYDNYLPPYDLNQFVASVSILQGKQWRKIFDTSIINISSRDPKFRSIRLNADKLREAKARILSEDEKLESDELHWDGTLRIKLNYPDFGHSVYPQLITSAVMQRMNEPDDKNGTKKLTSDIRQRLSIKYSKQLAIDQVIAQILKAPRHSKTAQMLAQVLSSKIEEYNLDNLLIRETTLPLTQDDSDPGRNLVNDRNWIDSVLGLFRKIGIVDKKLRYDRDEEEVDDVARNFKDNLSRRSTGAIPSESELQNVIINESRIAIRKSSLAIAEKLLADEKYRTDTNALIQLLEEEFERTNEVVAEMIAVKVGVQLSVNTLPPPPYTPLINSLSINYSSTKDLNIASGEKLYHVSPLGVKELMLSTGQASTPEDAVNASGVHQIFPERLISSDRNYSGMLFIGMRDVPAGSNVSMLIRLADGTAKKITKPPVIDWFYSKGNNWQPLAGERIISDGSFGFQSTGILELSIPADAETSSVAFGDKPLYWLCAAVEGSTLAFPNLTAISSQAALVRFSDAAVNPAHMEVALAAEKIKTLIDEHAAVKKIIQPVSSFNGKIDESDSQYYTRISERLRHKSRAITNWDYERLVLEKFPSLFKVKCLNNYNKGDYALGHITIIALPDFRNRNHDGNNMLLPKLSYIDLLEIEKYLSRKASPFVNIHASNAHLEHVLVSCRVKFRASVDKGYHLKKLNNDLLIFLTPWANGKLETVSFTAKIYASSIINFIDRLDYVDYVSNLEMQQYSVNDDGSSDFVKTEDQLTSLVETELKSGHSVLVSAPKHDIQLID